jgi:hypothetical protein
LARFPAQGLFDRRVDEDARDFRILRRGLDQRKVRRRPHLGVDVLSVLGNNHGGHHLFPFLPGKLAVGHGCEPDIGVEPDLMAGVAIAHGAPPRLRHVADEEPVPAGLRGLVG